MQKCYFALRQSDIRAIARVKDNYLFDVGDPHAPQVAIIDCSPRFLKIVHRTIFTVLRTAASRPRSDGGKTENTRSILSIFMSKVNDLINASFVQREVAFS